MLKLDTRPLYATTSVALQLFPAFTPSSSEPSPAPAKLLRTGVTGGFKASSKATQQHINARLDEGFDVEDFKIVIDKKCAEWLGTDFAQYLRPVTLFGTKFEAYLNAPIYQRKTYGQSGVEVKQPEQDDLAGIL